MLLTLLFAAELACIVSVIFIERKKPSEAVAWILVLCLLPGIGALLYLFLGETLSMRHQRLLRRRQDADAVCYRAMLERLGMASHRTDYGTKDIAECLDLIHLNLKSGAVFVPDNHVKLYVHGSEKYDALFDDLQKAQKFIHMEYFIIRSDDVGKKLVSVLAQKAAEGVEIRLLYDEFGCSTKFRFFAPLTNAGGQVRRFSVTRLGNLLRANYRNHRKVVVIDGVVGYTGGMNIGAEYTGIWKKKAAWRDTHLRLEGTAVYALQLRFLLDWCRSAGMMLNQFAERADDYFPPLQRKGNLPLQLVSSGPDCDEEYIKFSYLKLITRARKSVLIQSPYFVPDQAVLQALKIAAASGVDVKIMLPGVPDKGYVYYVTMSYMDELLKSGIRVYLYNGFLHAKMLVSDCAAVSIGTANMDVRSFCLNYEINTVIYGREFARTCVEQFYADREGCTELTREEFCRRPWWDKAAEAILRLAAPLF
ncbi:MAG: cardiolipin synthase [Ruminococcaceae bacterium]|nr:cardiolipin synthase [Oscillospiraceae bacterium]